MNEWMKLREDLEKEKNRVGNTEKADIKRQTFPKLS